MTSAIQLPVSIPFCNFLLACVAQTLLWRGRTGSLLGRGDCSKVGRSVCALSKAHHHGTVTANSLQQRQPAALQGWKSKSVQLFSPMHQKPNSEHLRGMHSLESSFVRKPYFVFISCYYLRCKESQTSGLRKTSTRKNGARSLGQRRVTVQNTAKSLQLLI